MSFINLIINKLRDIYIQILNVFLTINIKQTTTFIIKILRYFINIYFVSISLFLLIVLYNVLPIIPLIISLFIILVFSNFVIYYKYGLLNINHSFMINLLNRDYTFIFKRIVLIKFIFLYLYVSSDFCYCQSTFNRMAHELFMSMGSQVGVEQKTTVSTLETLGMIAIVGGVAYGSVKAYQMYTHTTPKSVEQRLNEKIDQLEARLNHRINNVQNNLSSNQYTISTQIEHTRINIINTVADIQRQNIEHFSVVGDGIITLRNQINHVQESVINLRGIIAHNQTQMNLIIKQELNTQLNKIEQIYEKQKDIINRNENQLSDHDKQELNKLFEEISNVMNTSTTLADQLPENIPITTSVLPYRPRSNLNLDAYRKYSANKLESKITSSIQTTIPGLKRAQSLPDDDDLEYPETSLVASSKSNSSLSLNKTYKITELTDNQIVFTSIGSNAISNVASVGKTALDQVTKRVFHGITSDVIINVAYNGLKMVLANSISGMTFMELLKVLGVNKSPKVNIPTTSQNVGHIISDTLRDFLEGLGKGWNRK